MPERIESLAGTVRPVVASLGLELYDVELTGSGAGRTLRVLVDREGGVDLDAVTAVTEALAPVLDHLPPGDAIAGPYALEVSSPGLERPLRRPEHYRGAVGATVSVKTREPEGSRRRRGVVVAADDDGFDLESDGITERIDYTAVTQARTVFEWGPQSKPETKSRGKRKKKTKKQETTKKKEAARS